MKTETETESPGMARSPRLGDPPIRWAWLVGLAAIVLVTSTGCVERRYTVRTSPPGARISVNSEDLGVAPLSSTFQYYGDRRIVLEREGYQTERFVQPIDPPRWYNPFTEFFLENLWPFTIRDEREYVYQLRPVESVPKFELRDRAESFRGTAELPLAPRDEPSLFGS